MTAVIAAAIFLPDDDRGSECGWSPTARVEPDWTAVRPEGLVASGCVKDMLLNEPSSCGVIVTVPFWCPPDGSVTSISCVPAARGTVARPSRPATERRPWPYAIVLPATRPSSISTAVLPVSPPAWPGVACAGFVSTGASSPIPGGAKGPACAAPEPG